MTVEKRPIIGVMGSHSEEWEEYSKPLGEMIALKGYNLLTGAGAGIMTEVAKSFTSVKERKGVCIGIIPVLDYYGQELLGSEEYPNTNIEIPIITPLNRKALGDSMPFSRNLVNIMSSDAIIILPGSHGTRNEASIALMHDKPMILFGPYDAFESFPNSPLRAQNIDHIEQFLLDVFG